MLGVSHAADFSQGKIQAVCETVHQSKIITEFQYPSWFTRHSIHSIQLIEKAIGPDTKITAVSTNIRITQLSSSTKEQQIMTKQAHKKHTTDVEIKCLSVDA